MNLTDTTAPAAPSDVITPEGAKSALKAYAQAVTVNPLTNSVFTLATQYFRHLEQGELSIEDLSELALNVSTDLIDTRAKKFRAQHRIGETTTHTDEILTRLQTLADEGFEAFQDAISRPVGGLVFTGHPTFALPKHLRDAFSEYVLEESNAKFEALKQAATEDSEAWASSITLDLEHGEVQDTLEHAHAAMQNYSDRIIQVAREKFPTEWRKISPAVPTLASWVGYDLDGRTDIQWTDSLSFRLLEKSTQLSRYAARLADIQSRHGEHTSLLALQDRLTKAASLTRVQYDALVAAHDQPAGLVEAANLITRPHPDRLTDAQDIISALDNTITDDTANNDLVAELLTFRSMVSALQLGTARIHLRLNAAQMGSVIKRDLGIKTDKADIGRVAISALAEKAKTTQPIPTSFADLYFEQTTARRQFMMCSVILSHIDAGSPIRFLIAESENPATVLSALYLARLYGVDEQLDISPLFETPEALVSGARFMERLLNEEVFQDYVKARGYVSIQLGFSDAGRFVGQIAANMAIERLHNLIGKAVCEKAPGLDLLIFNTHGESMGRGAYPGTFVDRMNHCLTPWTRAQNAKRGVHLRHEVSFQGGDGYLHFANAEIADATYSALCNHYLSAADETALNDPFYRKTDFVWDFYRALKAWHEDLLQRPEYENLLSDFAGGFLVRAGSRQRRRGGARGPRALRAISHNATLQQLGVPLNSSAGVGSSMAGEADRLIDLINTSPRMRHLIDLALTARLVTSVPSLRAYAAVYNPYLWTGFARQCEEQDHDRYIRVQNVLRDAVTNNGVMRIADTLTVDLIGFDTLLGKLDDAPTIDDRHEGRLPLHILHAVRQALMMRAFAMTAALPTFSDRHGINVDEVIDMVLSMNLDEAVSVLRQIFPESRDPDNAFDALDQGPAADCAAERYGYDDVHQDVIKPLTDIAKQLRSISLSLCHAYGAYG